MMLVKHQNMDELSEVDRSLATAGTRKLAGFLVHRDSGLNVHLHPESLLQTVMCSGRLIRLNFLMLIHSWMEQSI